MPITILLEKNKLKVRNQQDYEALRRAFYGEKRGPEIELTVEEALYLMEVRNAICLDGERSVTFSELVQKFNKPKLFAEYITFRDWRERGLMVRPFSDSKGNYNKNPTVKYPFKKTKFNKVNASGLFFKEDKMTILEDEETGKILYQSHWFGQYGSYKAEGRGRFLKLDKFETMFLVKNCGMELMNCTEAELDANLNEDPDFLSMYQVYEDWRNAGFIVKTGFKFGTHFRIYFPGALPGKSKDWTHSKHVLHIFPREKRMVIAEWARAIRVAHGVRKTFILAIPGKKKKEKNKSIVSFILYHRKGNAIETPDKDGPSFAMVSLSEEEMIGGNELAIAIEESKNHGLDVVLGIVDRETSVTYYRVKRIDLPESKYEYYEIEWIQP